MESTKTEALKAVGDKQTSATTAVESAQGKALDAVTDAQGTATQAVGTVQANAIQQMESTKTEALKAIGDKQTTATQAVDAARDKALQQVEASTEAAQTAASEAATSAGNADQSAQEAAGSLQELKDGIANGNFKGEPGNDGKSPAVTVTDIENGHRVSITDKDGTKTIDVLNGQAGKDAPQIDDATVTDSSPWSSKHIVDMLCPPLEETGNPVQCYPVAGYPLGVKASWEPTQEGTGDPSPDNIRPIKGRDSVSVERCGENLLEFLETNDQSSNISIVVDQQKVVTLNGTLTTKGNITIAKCRLHWRSGKEYTMRVKKISGAVVLGAGDGITYAFSLFSEDLTSYFRGSTNTTNFNEYTVTQTSLEEIELILMLQCWREGTKFDNYKFQIEVVESTTPPTAYSPYTGQTTTMTLPHTIYGGTVDAVTGEGKENTKILTLDGNELKFNQSTIYINLPIGSAPGVSGVGLIRCSHFRKGFFKVNIPNEFCFLLESDMTGLFTDVDDLNAYIAAQYAAGTPVQIAYKLAEPIPFTATGGAAVPALEDVNTVITDADKLTVTGRADPIKRIIDLEDAVASMT